MIVTPPLAGRAKALVSLRIMRGRYSHRGRSCLQSLTSVDVLDGALNRGRLPHPPIFVVRAVACLGTRFDPRVPLVSAVREGFVSLFPRLRRAWVFKTAIHAAYLDHRCKACYILRFEHFHDLGFTVAVVVSNPWPVSQWFPLVFRSLFLASIASLRPQLVACVLPGPAEDLHASHLSADPIERRRYDASWLAPSLGCGTWCVDARDPTKDRMDRDIYGP